MAKVKLNIRVGDTVQVISGNYKGATGEVLRTLPGRGLVVVKDVNMRKHHRRPSQNASGGITEGGIITHEEPIRISNVMLRCERCERPARVNRRRDADGTVERICKRCGTAIAAAS